MKPERVLCAALLHEGLVIAGYRHHNCCEVIQKLAGEGAALPGRESQGFLTSYDRFVSRAEAYKIAREQGQLLIESGDSPEEILISENLYWPPEKES